MARQGLASDLENILHITAIAFHALFVRMCLQVVVMSSDYMLATFLPDRFSLASAHGMLNTNLPAWLGWRAALCAQQVRVFAAAEGLVPTACWH